MKQRLFFLFGVFLSWILIFAIQKPFFLLYNHALAAHHSFAEFLQVIVHGLKLDATMAGYLTVLPLLLTIISVWYSGKRLHTVLNVYFAFVGAIVALIFSVDEALYAYWNFRLDSTVFFYLESPTNAMASVPLLTFFVQSVKIVGVAILLYFWFGRFIVPLFPFVPAKGKLRVVAVQLLLGGLLFIVIRGGVTTSTANVGMVYFSKDQFLNHAAINPCFSLLTSLSKPQDFSSEFHFFVEEKRRALVDPLYPEASGESFPDSCRLLKTNRPNILMVILEGFSANVVEAVGGVSGVTPNLNRLAKEGVLFRNMYGNSFRTDRGLVSALNGYLAQPTTSIMKYPAKSQTLPSIAKELRGRGYHTDVLYGGDINFTNMRSFFFNSGYDRLTSDVDFPLASRLSKWGANDDVTFEWLYGDIMTKKQSPWFTTFLTLSSHEPFKVPYQRLEHLYLNSVAFTDSCLGHFVDDLKATPAWDDLLIVFVSDHGFRYPETLKEYDPGRYHIPCIWVGGAIERPRVFDEYINQTDLAATLLAQLGLRNPGFLFSRNFFDPAYPRFAFYTFNNGFGFIDSTGVSVYDNAAGIPLLEAPEAGSASRLEKGKAILQTLYEDLDKR
ncbi:MAG: sulfatase-like hydrolase/transferase [Massilibacteroides sp.]|nr:sulfatase-like hydrolase/transferase [Massilibacteroides sp.]MDD3061835.1 sulfatase-like hydrolase/transferase [Massilibacteroides sp.]MDD4114365.1 sulfatase-like hydrolase/transferase [Massilibacteroides sp.]MDD4660117.1 sulfatase-like hydrolase/transferase [Massilibacteroides sp.]